MLDLLFIIADSGGDHRYPHCITQAFIHGGTPEYFRFLTDFTVDVLRGFGNLLEFHVAGGGEIHQNASGPPDRYIFKQRMRNRQAGGVDGTVCTG